MRSRRLTAIGLLLVAALASGCPGDQPGDPGQPQEPSAAPAAEPPAPRAPRGAHPFTDEELERVLQLSPLPPPPPDPTNAVADDPDAARLGQFLFFDERLSGAGNVSCASCHDPGRGWADALPLGRGVAELTRHTQSLWNVAHGRWFFWDGRADTLWSQALIPLEDPREHAGSRLQYAHLVHRDADLRAAYERVFGALPDLVDPDRFPPEGRPVAGQPDHPHQRAWASMSEPDRAVVNRVFANIGKAIAAFERTILTQPSPFDAYVEALRGGRPRPREFSPAAERGLRLFVGEAGCRTCHHGPLFTDMEFHNTRVPPLPGGVERDPGRYDAIDFLRANPFNGIGPFSDDPGGEAQLKIEYLSPRGHQFSEFKTPSLRNVAQTAPYMHQGQLATLEDVVRYYSTLETALPAPHPDPLLVPLQLDDGEVRDLVAFLESLTNHALPFDLMAAPPSPSR